MAENEPVYIISDNPEKDSGLFGFDGYAKTIAELIAYKDNKTPLVIGIYGPWGSGKTTLMQTVLSYFRKIDDYKDKDHFRNIKTVWFQAWKYKEEEEILAALIEEIFKAMKKDGFFENCKAQIETLVKKFDTLKFIGKFTELFSGVDVSEFFSKLEYREKLGFFDTFQDFFDRLLWDYLNWRPKKSTGEKPDDKKGVLVVFIDDLDRYPKGRILKVLETIKLFMDKEGCVFVIGAANEIIENALKETYGEDSSKFMDKIVQVTFNLPQVTEKDFESYIENIRPDIKKDISPHLSLITPVMQNNPRRLKRFLNNLSLQEGLLKNKGIQVSFSHLLYWNIIDYVYPSLRNDIKDNRQTFFTLRENIQDIAKTLSDQNVWDIPQNVLEKIPLSLQGYIKDKKLIDIIRNFDIDQNTLNQLVTLSGIAESVEEVKEKAEREERIDLDKMVTIPAGEFLYGDDKRKENIDYSFLTDVYPVTNSQYKKFVEAGGYTNKDILDKCWSEEGRRWRENNNITQPGYWDDEKWNQPDHPVVGVSYYEAEAYAGWAGKRLPTEKEWEKAARGADGRKYPWGNDFDIEKCNSRESGSGGTTRVTLHPNGISPYGCYDMAGNVWEWTDSWYGKDKTVRVVRGGAWSDDSSRCRCAYRLSTNPNDRDFNIGFRCARTLKL